MKFNPESQLNIHELAVEEPEKEKLNILFDFKRDVLPHKEQILSLIEDCRGSSWIDFTFLASRAKIIGIDVNLKNEDAERLQAERNSYKNSLYSAQLYFTQIAAREAILGTDPKLSNEEKGEIKAQAERFRNSRTAKETFFEVAAYEKILGIDPELKQLDKEEFLKIFTRQKESMRQGSIFNWKTVIELASTGIVLGIDSDITEKEKQIIRMRMDHWLKEEEKLKTAQGAIRENSMPTLIDLLSHLAIISADEVRIPKDGGLELIKHNNKQDLQTEASQIPEQKQF
ncbi:MAG: hypothetical protein A2360_04890 [Candidatus Staskawiczbacteria bacterium RIFOXYB1_FULL_32_11]|uniref:Uncharacterized protein n=1 Tax=Candidatus Staskawiczbacteria bacterium RIFOXYD1_FULL_32_13 TaxID=1802234 RepID=A0A1G2JKL9_9BACT|nr:MAG: hypothetical protein UR22_C0001G0015 [Parcubacteria group bacterium GW2011_GWC2_32_10]OGZ79753.1 MAG: hypothetical protein A2360_04890 [Candidatus Staskawiczbacteria bacterium RIFOXYB1_FULL_32_11]OGZ81028.1 MAG: hypothetical protein A2256_04225 [Candidatus Staskawiczbacteria bacterium RIFOXYA2_FULL_32_7]OGZ87654.1 MAG: hypothetical protein A2561_03075 [Candidatus Staskawiczbacteria bacterium RIFOXYD1_FULL_32_13]